MGLTTFTGTFAECLDFARSLTPLTLSVVESLNRAVSEEDLRSASARTKLHFLTQVAVDLLSALPPECQYTMFIDGIDVRPDDLEYEAYIGIVSALANTVWLINATQFQKLRSKLRIVLLIRPDIIGAISIHNRGTKLSDNSCLIEWLTDYENYDKSAIFALTDRLLGCQQDEPPKWPGDAWNHYFNFKAYNRITRDYRDNPFIIFLRHSFYKPRDIISYLEFMSERLIRTGGGGDDTFNPDVFRDTDIKRNYSKYMLDQIRDGLQFYYNKDEFEIFLTFCAFLGEYVERQSRSFTYANFCAAHEKFVIYVNTNKLSPPALFATPDSLLQLMYELNIIGFRYEGMVKGKL